MIDKSQEIPERISLLDGWRGLAIIGVLVDHYITARGINLGRFGVEMFFVLSGRLMADILFVRGTPIKTFFLRRFARVYPALIIFSSIIFILGIASVIPRVRIGSYLASITLVANYADLFGFRVEIFDHIWSLCVEEHMYILLAGIATLSRWKKLPVALIAAIIAGCFIVNGAIQTWYYHLGYYAVYWRSDVRGASILIAVACYLLCRDIKKFPAVMRFQTLPVLLGGLALALNFNIVPDPIKYSLGTAMLALSVVLLPQMPAPVLNWHLKVLKHPALQYIGIWSYSMYLWQQPFAMLSRSAHSHVEKAVIFLLMVACALASFYFLEQPARRAINRLQP